MKLDRWFMVRYHFFYEVITRGRAFPVVHDWAIRRMGDLLRPLPVRVQEKLLEWRILFRRLVRAAAKTFLEKEKRNAERLHSLQSV